VNVAAILICKNCIAEAPRTFVEMAISLTNPNKSSNLNSFNFDPPALQNERFSSRQRQKTAHFPDHIGSFSWSH
jgi:hypothetical protein